MVERLINLHKSHSFFLFGARGTGKTYLVERLFKSDSALYIDLLDPVEANLFALDPHELIRRIDGASPEITHICIDEIQKVPKLLDLVHLLIEKRGRHFVLTGSSARKLKRGGANLLAGRAFTYHLYPFSYREYGADIAVNEALQWGSLPKIFTLPSATDKELYLRTYVTTYLKEEIAEEQVVRTLDPFRMFLQVAAQVSGQIINYTNIARDTGVSVKTVQSYFQILEDTLLGTFVPPFHESIRKRQSHNPKFYLFDEGVRRALNRSLTVPLVEGTSAYGISFEHFVINEIIKLNEYGRKDFTLSYLRTYDDAEVDLIIDRPGLPRALVEIKSKTHVDERDLRHLLSIGTSMNNVELFCVSRDKYPKKIKGVTCVPWQEGLVSLGL